MNVGDIIKERDLLKSVMDDETSEITMVTEAEGVETE